MTDQNPSSVPTSHDRFSNRPSKRRALSPTSTQSANIEALFANPEADVGPRISKPKSLAAPPEIVANVQGSSAGAGSGEFHVYKASRRREYERLRAMDDEKRKEDEDKEYAVRREEQRRKDEEKTERNRLKREKLKARKGKGKGSGAQEEGGEDGEVGVVKKDVTKKRLEARTMDVKVRDNGAVEEAEDLEGHEDGNGIEIKDYDGF